MEKIICIILLVLYGLVMLMMCCITLFKKNEKPKNNVHFYIARDKDGSLWLHIGKPIRSEAVFGSEVNIDLTHRNFYSLGLNKNDYDSLRWEDEPIEVFINIKD